MTDDDRLEAICDKYIPLRDAQRTLNKRLQTMLPKPAFKECGQKLGFSQHGQLVFNREDDVAVFSDYMIYDYRLRGGTNAVERLRKLGEVKPGTSAHESLANVLRGPDEVLNAARQVRRFAVRNRPPRSARCFAP